jgi:hypothetical protein
VKPSFELRAIVFFAHCGARFSNARPLSGLGPTARKHRRLRARRRVTRLGQLIPQLGYLLARCAELLFELIDKPVGWPYTAPPAELKAIAAPFRRLDTPYWRGC